MKSAPIARIVFCVLVAVFTAVGLALADQKRPTPPDQSDPSDQKRPHPSDQKRSDPSDLSDLSDELLEKLEKEAAADAAPAEEEDPPLIRIGDRMRQVQRRLARADTGRKTIELQEAIIKDLDDLLKQMQSGQACPQCGKQNCQQHARQRKQSAAQSQQRASSQPSTQAARDASNRNFPRATAVKSKADLERMAKAIWGHLPPKMREQMEQALSATLLPQYELLIERYFRTLAEQGARSP